MMTVSLNDLRFHAFHGVHDEEKRAGGMFAVNMTVYFRPAETPVTSINQTVNYVALFELIKQRMHQASPLLETIAGDLATGVLQQFTLVEEVQVLITKLNPPIASFQGSVAVGLTLKRE